MLKVTPISAFTDNYIWLLENQGPHCAVVDPGDARPVLTYLEAHQLKLTTILLTHHHFDHVGGVSELLRQHNAIVYGPAEESISVVTHPLNEDDEITLPELETRFKIISIPGHTAGHIAYYGDGDLFCGDTLFAGGCGRLFEGTPADMCESLAKIMTLPDKTRIYCAHEYTENNLRFARTVDPRNPLLEQRLRLVQQQRKEAEVTLPSTLQIEKETNPFLRCEARAIIDSAESLTGQILNNPVDVFAAIRQAKDKF